MPMKYNENFNGFKKINDNFLMTNSLIMIFFLFFLNNIDCGYTLEWPHSGSSNEYLQSKF